MEEHCCHATSGTGLREGASLFFLSFTALFRLPGQGTGSSAHCKHVT